MPCQVKVWRQGQPMLTFPHCAILVLHVISQAPIAHFFGYFLYDIVPGLAHVDDHATYRFLTDNFFNRQNCGLLYGFGLYHFPGNVVDGIIINNFFLKVIEVLSLIFIILRVIGASIILRACILPAILIFVWNSIQKVNFVVDNTSSIIYLWGKLLLRNVLVISFKLLEVLLVFSVSD